MSDLARILSAELVEALEGLVEEKVQAALEAHGAVNGSASWLSVADAADHLGVSSRTVGRLLEGGHIRSTTIGRRRLLHSDDLDSYLRGDAKR